MKHIIDFTDCKQKKKAYAGANGNKICIVYNDTQYMLKFPALPTKTDKMSYTNSCVSEYLGCKIFQSVGIQTQDVILGTFRTEAGKEKITVACGDFTTNGWVLQDFGSLKNQVIDSKGSGYGTELNHVEEAIQEQMWVDPKVLSNFFWDMFIVDALIGNWDRHNGNWGFLYNEDTDSIKFAPIYDCGSCLYPQMDEELMKTVINNQKELDFRVYEIPTSPLSINNKRIKYFDFISSLQNDGCNEALDRMMPKIDIEKISNIIEETPFITDLQKDFYKQILSLRKEKILDYSYELLQNRDRESPER